MIKLKKLIKEHAWDRKFGEPLPTLKDVAEKHQTEEKETINEIDYGNVFADMGDKLSDFKMKVVKPGMRIYNKGKANSYMKDLYKSLEKCVDLCDMMNLMANESINEGKYHQYRNDDSLSPKQKIGYSMREVRDKLNELDKLVKMNVRLKNEVGVNSTDYWKNTHNAMKKISERLVKLANKVGQLY